MTLAAGGVPFRINQCSMKLGDWLTKVREAGTPQPRDQTDAILAELLTLDRIESLCLLRVYPTISNCRLGSCEPNSRQ